MDKGISILAFSAILLFISGCKADQPGTLKWKYKTGGPIESSPAIGQDGTVYITSMDSCLYAFDPEGNLKWKYQADAVIWSSPAIGDDGTVYFSSWESFTYALTPGGELKWKYKTCSISSPAIGYDGTLFVAATNGRLYAITPGGGVKWESSQSSGIDKSPPVVGLDGTIYSSGFNKVFAHDSSGKLKWSFEIPMDVAISAFGFDLDGNLGFCTWSHEFYVLSSQGELKKRIGYPVITSEWTLPVIDSSGTIYLGGGFFYALNPDYTKKWTATKEIDYGRIDLTPVIGSEGTIYAVGNGYEVKGEKRKGIGYLYALTPEGECKWRCRLGGEIKSPPAIATDGTIYLGSLDSCVYAVRSDSKGLANSPWPKFQHDNQNTGRAGGGN